MWVMLLSDGDSQARRIRFFLESITGLYAIKRDKKHSYR